MTSIWGRLAIAAAMLVGWFGPARGQSVVIDRVEEDWELIIGTPDYAAEGPQITTVMAPTGDPTQSLISFNLNYRGQPSYAPGGLETVAYQGEQVLASQKQHTARLLTIGETITWTQRLRITGGTLIYDIDGGESTTWSRFGQGAGVNLSVSVPAQVASLAAYSPEVSVENSGPGWQPNRVTRMRLLRVRYYAGGALQATDNTPRDIPVGTMP